MTNLIGVSFDFTGMCFYSTNKDVERGTKVVCSTPHGTFIGEVSKIRTPTQEEISKPDFVTIYPPIDRIANFQDIAFDREAKEREKEITKMTQQEADELRLDMHILSSYLDLSGEKVLITFTAESRVDFRDLVKILIGYLHIRVELRQIGPRDQAKLIGGIGPCGLEFCCTTFLNSFDGISISMAKNQLLAINIPKLSGQCGKLMCCLKYEDEAYAKAKEGYPKIGDKIEYRRSQFEVTGLNLLSGVITTYNGQNYEYFTLEQYNRVKEGLDKGDEDLIIEDVNSGVDLSGQGIIDTNARLEMIRSFEEKHSQEMKKQEKNDRKRRNNQKNKNGANRNNNNNNEKHEHSYSSNNRNSNRHYSHSVKKETGFIPVSQITDREVLNVKAVKKSDEEDE